MNRVLVLMSTYNGVNYIKPQIESILNQTLLCDLLIRDDGSKKDMLEILEKYEKEHANIQLIKGNNVGVIESFFALLKEAKGYDYFAFCDQDDIWFEDKIEVAVKKLDTMNKEQPALYASCSLLVNNDMVGEDTTQINRRGLSFNNVIIQNLMPGHSQVFNQKLVDLVLSHPIDLSKVVVHDYWFALLGITFGNVYFDNNFHTYYRQHGKNEIGYGHGAFGWFTERMKRIVNAKAKDITNQDKLFYDTFKGRLTSEQRAELEGLLFSQRNIFTRIGYLCKANVYRQRKIETILFYLLYLLGGYKVDL